MAKLLSAIAPTVLVDHNKTWQQNIKIKDLLINQLNHPPSLLELARQTGLNERNVKTGISPSFRHNSIRLFTCLCTLSKMTQHIIFAAVATVRLTKLMI